MTKKNFTILIADRNSHVRMFLLRELMAEGYRVMLAATADNVLKMVFKRGDIDLLILDPDLPGSEASSLLQALTDRIPVLPVVLHTHRQIDDEKLLPDEPWCAVIEKAGDSVEHIKEAVETLLSSIGRGESDVRRSINREGEIS